MSEPRSAATGKAGAPKKPVSPVRNIIGLVVLIGLLVVVWFEYSSYFGYKAAVNGLNERMKDETHGLMPLAEAEKLIGKGPDDAGSDARIAMGTYTKKNYTWKGLINSYTLVAYYTKEKDPSLFQFEANEKVKEEPNAPPPSTDKVGRSRTPKQNPAEGVAKPPQPKPDVKKPEDIKPDVKKPEDIKPDVKKPEDIKPVEKKPEDKKPDVKKPDETESKTPAKAG